MIYISRNVVFRITFREIYFEALAAAFAAISVFTGECLGFSIYRERHPAFFKRCNPLIKLLCHVLPLLAEQGINLPISCQNGRLTHDNGRVDLWTTLKPITHKSVPAEILEYIRQAAAGPPAASVIAQRLKVSRRTVNRTLARLVANGQIEKTGSGPTTGYRPTGTPTSASSDGSLLDAARGAEVAALLAQLSRPLGSRTPVSYERAFVDDYVPNESSLLPRALADSLYAAGRAQGQQPAGTVARKVLEQLQIVSPGTHPGSKATA